MRHVDGDLLGELAEHSLAVIGRVGDEKHDDDRDQDAQGRHSICVGMWAFVFQLIGIAGMRLARSAATRARPVHAADAVETI